MDLETFSNDNQQDNIGHPLVLAVDDNEDNLQLLTQVLMLLDYSFISAMDGHAAVLMAHQHQPDLILLDMMLPDMSGLDVVYQLKEDPKTMAIPIIAVTAMARAEDRERSLSAGCIDYIKKPYIVDELETLLSHYLCRTDAL